MDYNFDDYLNVVRQNIKNKKLHAPICTELESHLQDAADFYVEIGYDEETANQKALEDMGEPVSVGESMAKLHELSNWQKFLRVSFIIVAVLKIIDLLLLNIFGWGWSALFLWENQDFSLVGEFFWMILTVFVGLRLSLSLKRKAPAIFSIIIASLDLGSVFLFGFATSLAVKGSLFDLFEMDYHLIEVGKVMLTEVIAGYIFTALVVAALVVCFVRFVRIIDEPFTDSRKLKKSINAVMITLVSLATLVYGAMYAYVDYRDRTQFEAYSQVVSDMCDLCMENGRLTSDDYDMIIEKFDYHEFQKINPEWLRDDETGVYALIGEEAVVNPELRITIRPDGSLSMECLTGISYNNFDLSLRYFCFGKLWSPHNRWLGSDLMVMYLMYFTDNAQRGDSVDEYLEMVKTTSSDFKYYYDAQTGKEKYATELDTSEFFSQWYYYIYVNDGKFEYCEDMID